MSIFINIVNKIKKFIGQNIDSPNTLKINKNDLNKFIEEVNNESIQTLNRFMGLKIIIDNNLEDGEYIVCNDNIRLK